MKSRDSYELFEVFKPGFMDGATFSQKFAYWFKNVYWYHFRTFTLIALAAVILIAFLIADIVNKEHNDLDFVLGGAAFASTEQMNALSDCLGGYIAESENTPRIAKQMLCTGSVYGTGDTSMAFDEYASASIDKLTVSFADDEVLLYMLDKNYAEWYAREGAFEPLSTFGLGGEQEYFVRIDDSAVMKKLGIECDGGLYAAIKVINNTRSRDERIMKKYDSAARALKGILFGS